MRTILALALCSLSTALAQVPGAWTNVPSTPHPFAGSGRWAGTFDSLRGEVVFVYRGATWPGTAVVRTWNGTAWNAIATAAPDLQQGTLMVAYDPVRDRLVVTGAGLPTYEWDRVTWTPKAPSPGGLQLCWDPARQRVITVIDSGIHEWDGNAWTLVPGTALPMTFQYAGSDQLTFAVDRARNAIVGIGFTPALHRSVTVEWVNGVWSTWLTAHSLRLVDAPGLGGIVGSQRDGTRTWRWNPATHEWDVPGFGGSAGSFASLELAYDDLRGRLVMSNPQGLAEYDTSLVYTPRTFFVDPIGSAGYASINAALDFAVDGDRIVVAAGNYGIWAANLEVGVRVDCSPAAQFGGISVSGLAAGREVAWTGGTFPSVWCEAGAGRFRLKGATVSSWVRLQGNTAVTFEGCTLTSANQLPPEPNVVVGNGTRLTLDGCTVRGKDGAPAPAPWASPTPAASAVAVQPGGSLWVVNSTLTAGSSPAPLPSVPAITNTSSTPVQVLGASTLAAGAATAGLGTPCVGPVATAIDTNWLGSGAPPAVFPSPTWIAAPAGAAIGQALTITGNVSPGEFLFLFFAERSLYAPIPGFRLPVQIDASTQVLAAVMLPGAGSFTFAVPNATWLQGFETYWQGLVLNTGFDVTNTRSVAIR